jgi:hypothetical protein
MRNNPFMSKEQEDELERPVHVDLPGFRRSKAKIKVRVSGRMTPPRGGIMSGGAYDYMYYKVENFAKNLKGTELNPIRKAFQQHLFKVAKAMYEIEWVDSGDKAPGDEYSAINECISKEESIAMAEDIISILNETIEKLKGKT